VICVGLDVIAILGDGEGGLEVVNFWTSSFAFYATIWTSRVTLCLGLGRLFPSHHQCHRFSKTLTMVLSGTFVALTLFYVLSCPGSKFGAEIKVERCLHLTLDFRLGPFLFVLADLICNVVLIASPLYLVKHLKLPSDERTLMICLFSGMIVMFTYSLIVTVFWYGPFVHDTSYLRIMTTLTHIEASAALFIANTLVLIGVAIRAYRRKYERNPVFFIDSADARVLGSLRFTHHPSVVGDIHSTDIIHVNGQPPKPPWAEGASNSARTSELSLPPPRLSSLHSLALT